MSPVTLPETTKVLGNRSVWVVPTSEITDLDTVTVADLTAGFKATCYIYGNGGTVTGETSRVDAPRKLCEVQVRQNVGTTTETFSDISYSYKPQGNDADEANEMKEAMVFGSTVVIVDRLGITDETAPLAGQIVNVHRVTLGYQNRTSTSDDDGGEFSITQGASLDASVYDVVLT